MFGRKENTTPRHQTGSTVSRYDFIDSLRLLGARMSVSHPCEIDGRRGEMQEVTLNCSRDVWERVIGPPRNVVCHYSPNRRGLYHSWEHHWVGGSVKCFGCLFERASDTRWLFLSRVLFVSHPADPRPLSRPPELVCADAARQPA